MARSLKIVSPRRHPKPRGSEGSASAVISTKISSASTENSVIREAGFDLTSPFDLTSTQGSLRIEKNTGRRQSQIKQARTEGKEERIVLEAMNNLMVTISHYLSNPLTVLLGRVELLAEATENGGMSKEDIKKFTDSCRREINKIDLIIKVFQNLCEVRYRTYPPGVKMLDVEREIKNRLKEIEPCLKNE
ncbi:MAG: hypothetical protein AMJ73_05520 [candidate division Zixibacteria bacterium SM1_73]|nr:MAG: hypothetical protein AMJ73_05520 [candidate division Zixibacteria bacterium SM1_73]